MKTWLGFARGIDRLNDLVGHGIRWLVLAMVLLGAYNAVGRYVGRSLDLQLSSNAYLEAQWYMFSLVFLLAAAYALGHDNHVRVDVLYSRLSPRGRLWIDLVGNLLFLLPFCVFMLWVSWPSVANSWKVWEGSPDPGGLPRYPLKSMILVAFVLILLQGVSLTIQNIARLRGILPFEDDDSPMEHEPLTDGGHL